MCIKLVIKTNLDHMNVVAAEVIVPVIFFCTTNNTMNRLVEVT
jgi:hypothetical protein